MLFNSFDFIIFAIVVISLYWAIGSIPRCGHRLQNLFLLFASYYFYAYWDYRFLSLLLISTILDFVVGIKLASAPTERWRKFWISVSVVGQLGLLGTFKYLGFFINSAADLLTAMGFHPHWPTLQIILPVGISFYTFQSMSYTVDVYRRKIGPTRDLLDFALFVAFFPQLMAGPIERARSLLPRVEQTRVFNTGQFKEGIYLIIWGLYKKVFIADTMDRLIEQLFMGGATGYSGIDTLLGLYAFAIQIYCDFSGYTDMARGLAKLLGFELMLNFNLPYFAFNPSDFWTRWHISLSSWLREYLYFTLGGNRQGTSKTYRNLMLTMVLGGLWHGAAWNFVLWGTFHGAILVVWHWIRTRSRFLTEPSGIVRWAMIFIMFHLTCLGWLMFRSRSLSQIGDMFQRMLTDWSISSHTWTMFRDIAGYAWLLILLQGCQFLTGDLQIVRRQNFWVRLTFYLFVLCGLFETFGRQIREFIYFQF